MVLVEKDRHSFDAEHVQDLGWIPTDWKYRFNPDHVKDISDKTQDTSRQRSQLMQLQSASVNQIETGRYIVRLFNAVEHIRHYVRLSLINS